MPFYMLVASGRPDVTADEIILSRNEVTGEVEKSVSVGVPIELSDEEKVQVTESANLVGCRLVGVEEPSDEHKATIRRLNAGLPAGTDVVGESPIVEETPPSGAEVDQAAQEQATAEAEQADSDPANYQDRETSEGGEF